MTKQQQLTKVVHFFETVSPQTINDITDLYEVNAYFKDPFNEVYGHEVIIAIFDHMFRQVATPRFIIKQSFLQESEAFIIWDFEFCLNGKTAQHSIHGSSHIRFNSAGKVEYHRDYWDAAEELYEKIPLLGSLMRFIKRRARG